MNLEFVHPVSKPSRITYDSLSALARQGLGKSRLNPAEADEVRAAIERHRQRRLAREQAPRDPLAEEGRWLRRLRFSDLARSLGIATAPRRSALLGDLRPTQRFRGL